MAKPIDGGLTLLTEADFQNGLSLTQIAAIFSIVLFTVILILSVIILIKKRRFGDLSDTQTDSKTESGIANKQDKSYGNW